MRFPVVARFLALTAVGFGVWFNDRLVSDTWWSLRAGQDIWRTHHVLLTETYSYTSQGSFWPNHEWLWQVGAYGLWSLGGAHVLTAANWLIVMLALAFARPPGPIRRADAYALLCLFPLVLLGIYVRPQAASMLLFTVTLRLVGRDRWWPLVPLVLLWANIHGGVLLGVAAIGAAVAIAGVRGLVRGEWRRFAVAAPVGLACVTATLATPLGLRLWTTVANAVGQSQRDGVNEWASAFQMSRPAIMFWVLCAGCLLVVAIRRRRLDGWRTQFLMATTTMCAVETMTSLRNVVFFALAAMPLVIDLCRPADDDCGAETEAIDRRITLPGTAAILAVGLLAALVLPAPPKNAWTPISPAAVAAVNSCPGHVYTTYNSGGELIWWAPGQPVFEDNREYPYSSQILGLGLLGESDRSTDYAATFAKYDVKCAVSAADDDVRTFLIKQGWAVAYRDSQWSVLTAPGVRLTSAR